jgi:hypothetical protein
VSVSLLAGGKVTPDMMVAVVFSNVRKVVEIKRQKIRKRFYQTRIRNNALPTRRIVRD